MLKRKLKLVAITLMLAAIQAFFYIPTTAVASYTTAVRYANTDFSFENSDIVVDIIRKAEWLEDIIDSTCAVVSGPYYKYSIKGEIGLELDYAVYNLIFTNGKKGIIKLGVPNKHNGFGGSGKIIDDESPEFICGPYVLIGDEDIVYSVTENNVERVNFTSVTNLSTAQDKIVAGVVSKVGKQLYEISNPVTISMSFLRTKALVMGVLDETEPSEHGTDVPIVHQSDGDGHYTDCHLACVAAVVKTREPVLYSELDAFDVQDAFEEIDPYSISLDFTTIEEIRDLMHEAYLGDDQGHISYLCDKIYPETIPEYQFKSFIDNGTILLSIFGSETDRFHAIVMCKYREYSNGDILGLCMDPWNDCYQILDWNDDGFLKYDFGPQEIIYLESIINYT